MKNKLTEIFQALEKAYLTEGRPGGEMAASALNLAQSSNIELTETRPAPESLIEQAVKQPDSLPLAATIFDCCSFLKWENWAEDVLETGVSANLYTTELIGPDGLVYHDEVRIGLLVSAANTDYPLSSHSGEETYLVISGNAEWITEGQPYRTIKPGSLVHHPSWVPHGRRTFGEIFLGAWRWSGDLNLNSFQITDEGNSND